MLQMRSHIPWERASAFIAEQTARGFAPNEIAFMAQAHRLFSRARMKLIPHGRSRVFDIADWGIDRLGEALSAVKTPEDLTTYRESLVKLWAAPSWREKASKDELLSVMRITHDRGFTGRLMQWEGVLPEMYQDPSWTPEQTLLSAVGNAMARKELDLPPPQVMPASTGREKLRQVAKAAGVHSLAWNTWLYPPGEEAWLATQLESCHHALERLTGLQGPCLGLGGLVRLSLDDDMEQDSGGSMRAFMPMPSRRVVGTNLAGGNAIRLSTGMSWGCFGHEWVHALDNALAGVKNHAFGSGTDTALKAFVEALDHPPQTVEQVSAWLEEKRPAMMKHMEWLRTLSIDNAFRDDADRIEQVYAKLDAGEPLTNVHATFRQTVHNDYLESPQERLAFGFEMANHERKQLPDCTAVIDDLRRGTTIEREHAAEVFQKWFTSEQVQALWKDLSRMPAQSSLLDDLARRRHKQAAQPALSTQPAVSTP